MVKNLYKTDKMGVLVLVSHLVITLAIIITYVIFAQMGQPLTTIENMLLVIIGYWFGTMGSGAIRNQANRIERKGEDINRGE